MSTRGNTEQDFFALVVPPRSPAIVGDKRSFAEIRECNERVERLQKRLRELDEELKIINKANKDNKLRIIAELNSLKREHDGLKSREQDLKGQLSTLQEQYAVTKGQLEALEGSKKIVDAELLQVKAARDMNIDNARAKMAKNMEKLTQLKDSLTTQLEAAKTEIVTIKANLAATQKTLDETQANRNTIKKNFDDLKAKIMREPLPPDANNESRGQGAKKTKRLGKGPQTVAEFKQAGGEIYDDIVEKATGAGLKEALDEAMGDLDAIKGDGENAMSSASESYDRIIDIRERVVGAVRVYVRIKGDVPDKPVKNPLTFSTVNNIVRIMGIPKKFELNGRPTDYGSFAQIYGPKATNEHIFYGADPEKQQNVLPKCVQKGDYIGVCRSIDEVRNGTTVILFGYGFSGSGKSYTLINQENSILPMAVQYLTENYGAKVLLENVRELKVTIHNQTLSELGDRLVKKALQPQDIRFSDVLGGRFEQVLDIEGLHLKDATDAKNAVERVLSYQKKNGSIKFTLNNPESSRAHTFYTLKLEGQKDGKLIVVDLAGSEGAHAILHQMIPVDRNVMLTLEDVKRYLSNERQFLNVLRNGTYTIKNSKKVPQQITVYNAGGLKAYDKNGQLSDPKETELHQRLFALLYEGVFINETLNQLKLFCQRVSTQKVVNPPALTQMQYTEPGTYDMSLLLSTNEEGNRPIEDFQLYKELEEIYISNDKQNKMAKFIMMCCIRSESTPVYLEGTLSALDFAQQVSSKNP